MILLDTNALLWLDARSRRTRPLDRFAGRLYVSPASVLELQFLCESGRLQLEAGHSVTDFEEDSRWLLDDPPSADWFRGAHELSWTRDPFDRLIVAHARFRGWRLATGDRHLIEHVPKQHILEL